MNVDRLLKLADFLESVPPERFNLRRWADVGFSPDNCGTAACAIGWATTIFPELRLSSTAGSVYDLELNEMGLYGDDSMPEGWDLVQSFFDLGWADARILFEEDSYPRRPKTTPIMVADRIRQFVADMQKESL